MLDTHWSEWLRYRRGFSTWLLGMALSHFVNDETLEAMVVVVFEHGVVRDVPYGDL